jgi:hypothetical protein
MSRVTFLPLGFTPSDREALMAFDRGVCKELEIFGQFARPLVSWEMSCVPELEARNIPIFYGNGKPNVTVVRKMSDEFRLRRYMSIPDLILTEIREIEVPNPDDACCLCNAPSVCKAFYMEDEIKTPYSKSGGTHHGRIYGLCQKCFDLPDRIERVEKELCIIE